MKQPKVILKRDGMVYDVVSIDWDKKTVGLRKSGTLATFNFDEVEFISLNPRG